MASENFGPDNLYNWHEPDGHAVWFEEGEGADTYEIEHPQACMKEERFCPHREDGKDERDEDRLGFMWSPFIKNVHEDDECPDPIIYHHADCALSYEMEMMGSEGLIEAYMGDEADLAKISRDPDNPTPMRYWHEQQHSQSGPWGPEEWWTEWGWKINA